MPIADKYRLYAYKLFYCSIVIYLILLFHPLVSVMFLPAGAKGVIVDQERSIHYYTPRYSNERREVSIYAPVISFTANKQPYKFTGGYGSYFAIGDSVPVLYNRFYPAFAMEQSMQGCIDFRVMSQIWAFFLISGFFYAASNRNPFEFRMRRLNFKWFFSALTVALIIPLLFHIDEFMHGKLVRGRCSTQSVSGTEYAYTVIEYTYHGVTSEAHPYSTDSKTEECQHGDEIYVLVDERDPTNGVIFHIANFYRPWQVAIIILLVVFSGCWYLATKNENRNDYPEKLV